MYVHHYSMYIMSSLCLSIITLLVITPMGNCPRPVKLCNYSTLTNKLYLIFIEKGSSQKLMAYMTLFRVKWFYVEFLTVRVTMVTGCLVLRRDHSDS